MAPVAAMADGIPLDDAGFTTYIQQKLQLYSPAPVRVTAPFSVAIGADAGANLVFTFKSLHDDCVRDPASCPGKTHDYVQDIVRKFPAANSAPPLANTVPSDKDGFMAWLVAEGGKLLPTGAKLDADGMTLNVTRPGGRAVPLDMRGYYQLCQQSNFVCADPMRQSIARASVWLSVADTARLRVSLHIMASCSVVASVGNSLSCTVRPSPEPMSSFFRRAFANLEEVCFKQIGGDNVVPLLNADRKDAGLSIGDALDLCDKDTHEALGPLPADGAGVINGPYAASRALYPADWASLAQANGGHLIIAVPSRDMLLYAKGDDEAAIAALGARAMAVFASSPLGISSDVYRWNGDGWSLATDRSTMPSGPLQSTDVMPQVH